MSLLEAARGTGTEPGPRVVAVGVLSMVAILLVDLGLGGRVSLFFDLSFVVLCLVLAVRADRSAFFAVGITPPLLMLGAFVLIGAVAPQALARAEDGAVQAVVSGMLLHAPGLAAGYTLCLLTLAARMTRD
ncbi:MAG TPA: DUF6542 domain-containing protein [Nocardioides sp.]